MVGLLAAAAVAVLDSVDNGAWDHRVRRDLSTHRPVAAPVVHPAHYSQLVSTGEHQTLFERDRETGELSTVEQPTNDPAKELIECNCRWYNSRNDAEDSCLANGCTNSAMGELVVTMFPPGSEPIERGIYSSGLCDQVRGSSGTTRRSALTPACRGISICRESHDSPLRPAQSAFAL